MSFRIKGLPAEHFNHLFALSHEELAKHGGVRRIADDRRPGYPCRISLTDSQPGDELLLLNYEHLAVDGPYQSRYAIYVRENARDAELAVSEIPPLLYDRLLSVRAFSAAGTLLDADVATGAQLAPTIERLLAPSEVAYLHLHNARPGCYAARVDRA